MSVANPMDLNAFLEFDFEQFERDHRTRRTQAIRDRFLAGLLVSLREHPQVEGVWIELAATSSTHWVRNAEALSEHDSGLKGKTTDDNRALKAFYASLAPMRSAISSNARDTAEDLKRSLAAWKTLGYHPRGELIHLIEHLLANPSIRLTPQVELEARVAFLEQALPGSPKTAQPRARM